MPAGSVVLVAEPARTRGVRLTSPQLEGWVIVATTERQLAAAVVTALRTAQARGVAGIITGEQVITGECTAAPVAMRARRSPGRRDNYPPTAWSPLPGGRWVSPAGRVYAPGSQMAQRMRERWLAQGLDPDRP